MDKQGILDKLNEISSGQSPFIKDAERRHKYRWFINIKNRIHLKWLSLKRRL